MFNLGMSDLDLINAMGGSTRLARELGFKRGGAQRVQNWKKRGIPPRVKQDHPAVFRLAQKLAAQAAAANATLNPAHPDTTELAHA